MEKLVLQHPVFITARFRTGSTMLWNVFHQIPEVKAYYEPLHEQLPQMIKFGTTPQACHYHVDTYFKEYPSVEELVKYHSSQFGVCRLYMTAKEQHPQLKDYIHYLLKLMGTDKTAVLQCNRLDFRLPWIKVNFPGTRIIHLYRSPRDQWLSSITHNPKRAESDVDADPYLITTWARDLYRHFPFLSGPFIRHAYQRHYYLWKLSYLAGSRLADVSISYEAILESPKATISKLLEVAGLNDKTNIERSLAVVVQKQIQSRTQHHSEEWFVELEQECESMLTALNLNQQFEKNPLAEIIAGNSRYQELLADRRVHLWAMHNSQLAIIEQEKIANEKERMISKLHHVAEQRLHELLAKDRDLNSLQRELEAKGEAISSMNSELVEKEEVIQMLKFFRYTSLSYWLVYRLLRPLLRTIPLILNKLCRFRSGWFALRLGKLCHYPPIPLEVPLRYYTTRCSVEPLPAISIVTPSFNYAAFLKRTIESVLEQNYPKLEYIIQDGASTDDTEVILKRYRTQLYHVESRQDKGQANAINLGFAHATGEIMAWLNSDDLLLPGTLHYVAEFFATHPEVDVVYGHRILIDDNDQEIGRWVLPRHDDRILNWADYIPQETLLWRRRTWDRVGGYLDESYQFALDWELLLRFQAAGAKMVRLPRFLGAFRVHTAQKTSAQINETGRQEMGRLGIRCHGRSVSGTEIGLHIRPYLAWSVFYHELYRLGVLRY
ncbi:MAG: glycosyltransferase [Candidatus Scalindua sp.]|nr:glycosyltransferase [Candidatus Scalindua sp.]